MTVAAVAASWGARHRQLRATTSPDGRYAVRVPAGSWSMAADRADLVTRWTGTTTPHERPFSQESVWQPVAAGGVRDGLDFRLLPRSARSCWDLMEIFYAGGGDGPPIAVDRRSARQNELETWIAQNGDLIRAWIDSGLAPPAERPTGYPPGHPLHVPVAGPLVAALRPALALPAGVSVPRDRFAVRTRCSVARPCAAGVLTATAARGRAVRVARGRLTRSTRARAVSLRLTSGGRRLLRTRRTLPVRIRWTAPGAKRAVPLGTLRLRATPRR